MTSAVAARVWSAPGRRLLSRTMRSQRQAPATTAATAPILIAKWPTCRLASGLAGKARRQIGHFGVPVGRLVPQCGHATSEAMRDPTFHPDAAGPVHRAAVHTVRLIGLPSSFSTLSLLRQISAGA